jgi:hypothetical protein
MYSQEIVDIRKSVAAEIIGYELEQHTTDEVDEFSEHLSKSEKYNAQNQIYFSRELKPWEFKFIQNEKYMCQADAAYWLTRYAHVANESDQNVRFRFRDTQRIYFSVISSLEAKRSAIELIIAKGRQQFVTTITELLVGHRVFFHNDTNALVASADRVKTEEMGKKILFAYDNMPWWLKPKWTRRVESIPGLLEFEALNTRVTMQHGSTQAKAKGQQRVGLGRGGTRTVFHISEVSSFPKPEEQIEASLLRATHAHPKVFGILESTFAGNRGWFPEKYDYAKVHRSDGQSRLIPIFFSFPCARDIYPTKTWEHTHPVPYGWEPEGKVLEQINKAELFIRNDPLLSEYFGPNWEMDRAQKWFYNLGYREAEQTGAMSSWMQEMPVDDEEARISSFDSVFGKQTLINCHTNREKQFDVYSIVGQSVESEMEPSLDEIDYHGTRIPINHKSRTGEIYQWELVPIKYSYFEQFTGESNELDAIDGKLFVFKQPYFRNKDVTEQGRKQEYGVGGDSATGIGRDFSALCVTQRGVGAMPDIQAAEWRSTRVGHVEIFAYALPLCLYFRQDPSNFLSYPMFAIEQLASVGDVCQKEMKILGYPFGRFYNWGRFDSKQIKSNTNKQGWYTTGYSRPYLIGTYVACIRNGWYVLNSPWTIEDCREFEVHRTTTGKEKWEHSDEGFDDTIFAGAISTFIIHDRDSLADRSKNQRRGVESTLPPIDLNDVTGNSVNIAPINLGRRSSYNPYVGSRSIDDIVRGGNGRDLDRFRY